MGPLKGGDLGHVPTMPTHKSGPGLSSTWINLQFYLTLLNGLPRRPSNYYTDQWWKDRLNPTQLAKALAVIKIFHKFLSSFGWSVLKQEELS